MSIAIVAPLFAPLLPGMPFGPYPFLVDLARTLQVRGHRVAVYCSSGSRIPRGSAHRRCSPARRVARHGIGGGSAGLAGGRRQGPVRPAQWRPRAGIDAAVDGYERVFGEMIAGAATLPVGPPRDMGTT